MAKELDFRHAPTLDQASMSNSGFRLVEGPVNSGKSVWSLSQVYAKACTVPRGKDALRKSRFLVVRTSYPELEKSTLITWDQWFPEESYGPVTGSGPYTHKMAFADVECEVVFMSVSLDDPDKTIKALRSTEWTGIWVNEAQFIPLSIVKELWSRSGRYPSRKDCPKYDRRKWLVADMNAPSVEEHWSYLMRGKTPMPEEWDAEQRYPYDKPDNWTFYEQPAAVIELKNEDGTYKAFQVNPKAENLFWIGEDSIREELSGRSVKDVRKDLMNHVIAIQKGAPRYTTFDAERHTAELMPMETLGLILGYDPGLNGCIHIAQRPGDKWHFLQTIMANGRGAKELAEELKKVLNMRFPFWRDRGVTGWGDPYGDTRFGASKEKMENTHFDIVRVATGIRFRSPSSKDNPTLRHETGKKMLLQNSVAGGASMLVDKRYCKPLIRALDGGMTMRTTKLPDGLRTIEEVDKKNKLADVGEAWEYAIWGGGEGTSLVRSTVSATQINSKGKRVRVGQTWRSKKAG